MLVNKQIALRVMGTWPLTGRGAELSAVNAAMMGVGNGVVIAGSAGVGKTRIANEAAAIAESLGWTVRYVPGTTTMQRIPLGAFSAWTGRVDGTLNLIRHVIDRVADTNGGAPVLLVVDDAHLLDDISAFTVLQLVLRRRARVVATIRTGEPTPDAVIALWKDNRLVRMDLQPLSLNESHTLLTAVLGGALDSNSLQRLWDFTRGNVLFLRQLVDHELAAGQLRLIGQRWTWSGPTSLPPSLVDLVELQVGAVDDTVLDVVDLLAVAEPLELQHLHALAAAQAIEAAEQQGLVTVVAPLVRIAHPLYGEVRRRKAGALRLRHLRGRVARHLVAVSGSGAPVDPVRLGVLWRDSDLSPDRDILSLACWAAVPRLDLKTVEQLAAAAIDAGAGVDVAMLRARMLILLNRGEEAAAVLDGIPDTDMPPELRDTLITLRAANLLWVLARPEESWALLDDALDAADGPSSDVLLVFRAVQLATAGRPDEAVEIGGPIDRSRLAPLHAMLASWALAISEGDRGHTGRAVTVANEGYALAAASPEISFEAINLACFHVAALSFAGEVRQAQLVADGVRQACADVPGITQSVASAIVGMAALYRGDLATALARLGSAVAEFEAYGGPESESYHSNGMSYQFLILHAHALALSGDADAAARALTVMERHRPRSWAYIESDRLLAAAWVAATEGRINQAQQLANSAVQFARDHHQYGRETLCLQHALHFGDTDERHGTRLSHLGGLVDGPRAALAARWATTCARNDGHALLAVSTDFEAMGDPVAAADSAAHAAAIFSASGSGGAVRTAATRAARLCAAAGIATPATAALSTSALDLTPRELDVAGLVADGLSNTKIAERFTMSVRTVEGHIYRSCAKLGLANRAELARLITEYRGYTESTA
jgi:DNA-binding CsgD family transcriptional regulator